MLDIKRIRDDFENVKKAVESRGQGDFGIDKVLDYDKERRALLAEVEQMKNRQSTSSKQIPVMKKEGKDTTELMAEMKQLSEEIKVLDGKVSEVESKLREALLNIPNTPYKDVQVGADDSANVELRKWGEPAKADFEMKAHWDIGTDLDILDFERASKISGTRFTVVQGPRCQTGKIGDKLHAQPSYGRARIHRDTSAVHGEQRRYDRNRTAS